MGREVGPRSKCAPTTKRVKLASRRLENEYFTSAARLKRGSLSSARSRSRKCQDGAPRNSELVADRSKQSLLTAESMHTRFTPTTTILKASSFTQRAGRLRRSATHSQASRRLTKQRRGASRFVATRGSTYVPALSTGDSDDGHNKKEGGLARPPPPNRPVTLEQTGATSGRTDRSAFVASGDLGSVLSGDLVEGRVGNLVGLNLRRSLHH